MKAAVREYKSARVRGLAPWNPRRKTRQLLEQVQHVLAEYAAHLPLSCRQIFYRLVGRFGFEKTERAYKRLLEMLNRARRAGFIDFDAIRDDGAIVDIPQSYQGPADFYAAVRSAAYHYQRDRMANQDRTVECWVEANGMVPQVVRVAHDYGIGVYSSGGFDSTTIKHQAARRALKRDRPTVVLHVGDYDPSGMSIFDSAADDVSQLAVDLEVRRTQADGFLLDADEISAANLVEFRRVVVTPEQVATYRLPEAPPKETDRRGEWNAETVQAEALSPDQLANELRAAFDAVVDRKRLDDMLQLEAQERAQLVEDIDRAFGEGRSV